MPYGPISTTRLATVDMVAPDAVLLQNVTQISNKVIEIFLTLPATDSNGDNLSGLSKLMVATATVDPSAPSPFDSADLTMEEIIAGNLAEQYTEVSLSPAQAGTDITVSVLIVTLGKGHAFAVACAD